MTHTDTRFTTAAMAEVAAAVAAAEAELEAARAAAEAAEADQAQWLEETIDRAGAARVTAIEDLCDLLGIEPAAPVQATTKRGKPRFDRSGDPIMEDPDADERDRMRRLVEAVRALVDGDSVTTAEDTPRHDDQVFRDIAGNGPVDRPEFGSNTAA